MTAAVLRALARIGFRRALSSTGGRGWLAVGVAAMTLRILHRRGGQPKASIIEKIEPGHSLVISHFARAGKAKH